MLKNIKKKIRAMRIHVALRERYWDTKYTGWEKTVGYVTMFFTVTTASIIAANKNRQNWR